MQNNIIQRVVLLGTIAIIGIIGIQSYWVLQTWNLKNKEFQQTVNIALLNTAKRLANLSKTVLPEQNLVNQVSSNYYIVNINDNTINSKTLEYYLQSEFEAMAMKEDFEYGIYDCANNKIAYGNYVTYSQRRDPKEANEMPITHSEFPYYFAVRFPNKTSYMLNNMWLTISFSAILLLAVLFFLYSIFIILRQKQLSEMQKDFINNMTHEFKTPISTINISADMFLKTPVIQQDKRLFQYANIIKEQNIRLNNQVEKVLQLARIEKETFQLNKEEINLHELIYQTFESIEIRIQQEKGIVKYELNATNPVIMADRLHLTNILHNLLDNAIKYCKQSPDITVITNDVVGASDKMTLTISDKGIGIPKEYRDKVFNKFFRVPTGNLHDVKGFGLGLYYVKNICQAHGWKIGLQSVLEEGTSISIILKKMT